MDASRHGHPGGYIRGEGPRHCSRGVALCGLIAAAPLAARPELGKTISALVLTHAHIDRPRRADMVRAAFTLRTVVDNAQDRGMLPNYFRRHSS